MRKRQLKNKKQSRRKVKVLFIYYAIIAILLIIGITYSNYLSTATAEGVIDVAMFKFKVGQTDTTLELNLKDTIQANAYSDDEIIPGTTGKIILELDFSDIAVTTNYSISLDTTNTQIPTNMKLYTDSSCTVEFSGYTGTTELDTTELQREIYWKWNYTSTDETTEWMGQDIKIVFNIEAEQRVN